MSPFVLSKKSPFYYSLQESPLPAKTELDAFDFATYNAHFGERPQDIARAINSNPRLRNCDVIAIQEIEAYQNERTARIQVIANLCGFHCVYAPARAETRKGMRGTHGLAILSRYPLEDIDVMELPRFELGPKTRRRICVTCKVRVGNGFIRMYNAHLDTRISAANRIAQIEPIVRDALRFPDDKIIIAGDINTIPSFKWRRNAMPLWRMGQRLVIDAYMREQGFAFHEPSKKDYTMRWGLKMMLDAVYVKNLGIQESAIEYSVKNSDHFPLRTRLSLH
jgi:endonuclease/exonuclease/phosphatase family metal-dependent hydrolase